MKDITSLKWSKATDLDLSTFYYTPDVIGYRLNMPVRDVFNLLGAKDYNSFYDGLNKIGIESPFVLIASEKDAEDYHEILKMLPEFGDYCGPEGQEETLYELVLILENILYKDIPFEKDRKWGLRCTTGRITVPPLFDYCEGAYYIFYAETMARVWKGGVCYMTPRNGRGEIDADSCFDDIRNSFCTAWVKRNGFYGLMDARTGVTLVPYEMDYMFGDREEGNWFLSKGDKISKFCGDSLDNATPDDYYAPQFDAVDVVTGQVCSEGRWGWLLKDHSFTQIIARPEDVVYFEPIIEMPRNYADVYYDVIGRGLDKIKGVRKISHKFISRLASRMNLPVLTPDKIKVPILPEVSERFTEFMDIGPASGSTTLSFTDDFGHTILVRLERN